MKDDLISRQAAIDVADAVWSVTGDKNVAKVWDQLKDLPSAQPGQKWIPCSERMPFVDEYGKSDQVLATCGLQGAEASSIRWLRILYFNGCNWCFPTGESYEQMVYAWMPLPTPYREGGQDNTDCPLKEISPGHWMDKGSLSCRCSECGCKSPKEYPYCPNCGTPMEK